MFKSLILSIHTYLYLHIHACIHKLFSYTLAERYWEMIDRLKITHLYTIPTVMKFLMKAGDEHVEKYSLSTLKVLALGTTVQLWG